MKIESDNIEDVASLIARKVLRQLKDFQKTDQTKLIAVCQKAINTDDTLLAYCARQRIIKISADFQNLSTLDKLIVIKSAIYTHYQVQDGIIPGLGKILYYELVNEHPCTCPIQFNIYGKLIDEKMKLCF